ncbi:MAG: peptidoglycan-binding domain-containing protein [Pseudoxanthomonas sp.]
MEDLASGRLPIDPERRTQGIEARPVVDDGVIRIGESTGVVRHVQQALNEAGFRGADNLPLAVDGVYRLSMQAAVINYQAAHGLAQSGDIDAVTLNQIAPRIMPPAVNETEPGGGIDPRLPHFMNRQSVLPDNGVPRDPLLPQAEEAVRRLGRDYDEQGACMAASVACLAKANGLSRIDHIVLSEARGDLRPGDNLFVVQGALNDPAHHRVQMKTQDAIGMPVEQSLARLQALNDTQPQQSQHPTIGNPARQIDSQVRLS